ncbi:MAG: dicarboxylate/amino acid:cation symporter [Gammaproteobacteria bacterium]|nr:dicarboxylate/amino acid:cation symporter [Gammaproteobacteria bacterium]
MQTDAATTSLNYRFTWQIILAMFIGIIAGLVIRNLPAAWIVKVDLIDNVFNVVGTVFLLLIRTLIAPVLFIALIDGIYNFGSLKKSSRLAMSAIILAVLTTVAAIGFGFLIANLFHLGVNSVQPLPTDFKIDPLPTVPQFILSIIPGNPITAFVDMNIFQILILGFLFAAALSYAGVSGKKIADFTADLKVAMTALTRWLMRFAPYGIFCLMTVLCFKLNYNLILDIFGYFLTILLALVVHAAVTYGFLLFAAGLNPLTFFKKMFSTALFAFNISSSNSAIPFSLEQIEHRLGVKNQLAAFVFTVCTALNKNGTAVMQAAAAVFIAHVYHINIDPSSYLVAGLIIILASIMTAGIPGTGLITLSMVLAQIGVPPQGIVIIIGVDRLLDMARTAINVLGNAAITCALGVKSSQLDTNIYES